MTAVELSTGQGGQNYCRVTTGSCALFIALRPNRSTSRIDARGAGFQEPQAATGFEYPGLGE